MLKIFKFILPKQLAGSEIGKKKITIIIISRMYCKETETPLGRIMQTIYTGYLWKRKPKRLASR